MTNENIAFAAPITTAATVDSGRDYLDEMMARVGVDGLAAAFADAGLLAWIDQHAAAVRESLTDAERAVDADGLAGYARSIAAGALRMGRLLPEPGEAPTTVAGWMGAEWLWVRLVAVCLLAVEADVR